MKLLTYTLLLSALFLKDGHIPNPVPQLRHKFIVVCHRGDHTVFPENTLKGYEMAINDDADYVEIDLRTTKDGKLVSMHDGTVNRMTDGKGNIRDLTLAEVENLKVKPRSKEDTVTYRVPTFEEILKLCKDKIYIYIDFKEADAQNTLDLLKKFGMEKQVLVYINQASQVTDWRKTYPRMPLMFSLPDNIKDTLGMKKVIDKYQVDVLDGDYSDYSPEMVKYGQNLGITVWPDAQSGSEGPIVWDKVLALGFRGMQTDHPQEAIKYLKEKGLR